MTDNLEGTYVPGTEFAAWQMKSEIAGRQPYPLFDAVLGVASSMFVGLYLLSPDCVSKVMMSLIPSLLAALYPIVYGWDIGGFS